MYMQASNFTSKSTTSTCYCHLIIISSGDVKYTERNLQISSCLASSPTLDAQSMATALLFDSLTATY